MANWCNNIIEFTGDHNKLENLQTFFEQMSKKETETGQGQLPPFFKDETGYLFNINWEDGILYFYTKWSPNIEIMQQVADKYDVGFIYNYSETANLIYGEVQYNNGMVRDVCLELDDFVRYKYRRETDDYTFAGDSYESDDEILEILLERKKAITRLQMN